MAKKEDRAEAPKDDRPVTREEFNNLEAYCRKHFKGLKDNWLKFLAIHHGSEHNDGKL